MKKYIDAKLQIVRSNDDIVTASPTVGLNTTTPFSGKSGDIDAPGRRSIWD